MWRLKKNDKLNDSEKLILRLAMEFHIPPDKLIDYPMTAINKMALYIWERDKYREMKEFEERQKLKLRGLL